MISYYLAYFMLEIHSHDIYRFLFFIFTMEMRKILVTLEHTTEKNSLMRIILINDFGVIV